MFERCLRKAIWNGVLVIFRQLRRNNIFWKVSLIPMSPEWDNKWKLFNTIKFVLLSLCQTIVTQYPSLGELRDKTRSRFAKPF